MQRTPSVRELAGELIDKYPPRPMPAWGAGGGAVHVGCGRRKECPCATGLGGGECQGSQGCANWPGLRLAAVMLDEKAYDEALKQLAAEPTPAFAAALRRIAATCSAAQGKIAEARKLPTTMRWRNSRRPGQG